MQMLVTFANPNGRERKLVKVGFSWTLFFFAPLLLGLPLYARGLGRLGAFIGIVTLINIIGTIGTDNGLLRILYVLSIPIVWIFPFWIGFKGNRLTALAYLKRGWVFAEPDSNVVRLAAEIWKLPQPGAAHAGTPLPQAVPSLDRP